jgi:transcriptional regulator with XRE-family HTH domain
MHDLLDEVRLVRQLPPPEDARAVRIKARVSLRRLAQEQRVHECTIHRWESGSHRPRAQVAIRYAEILAALQEASA